MSMIKINAFNTLQRPHYIMKMEQNCQGIKAFINKYNWKGINYPSGKDDQKKFEKNNPIITRNVLYVENEYISWLHVKTKLKS